MTTSDHRDVSFEWRGFSLGGSLHLPVPDRVDDELHPVVVMMQGSGPGDRDGNGYFPPIRDALVGRGVAVYSFDKPGCGESTGDWRRHGLDDRADQAVAALDVVRSEPELDPTAVGVWGQSQGGWLVQRLAGRDDLAFAVANSGPSLAPPEQDLYGCEHTMRGQGRAEVEIRQALAYIGRLHQAARDGLDYSTVEDRIVGPARSQPWYGYLTIDDQLDWELIADFVRREFDPVDSLGRVRCPFLAVFGGLDELLPAWRCARETGEAVRGATGTDSTVVVFPGGDHRITDGVTGELVDGYLDLLGDWVARRAGTWGSTAGS